MISHAGFTKKQIIALALASLVLLSGCNAFFATSETSTPTVMETPSPTSIDSPTETPTSIQTPTATATPTPTATPEPVVHPWANERVVVYINNQLPNERAIRPAFKDALKTWNGTRVTGGQVSFRLTTARETADVVLTIKPRITTCGGETASVTFDFCVPTLAPGQTVQGSVSGTIAGLYDNETFVAVTTGAIARLLNREPDAAPAYPPDRYRYHDPWPDSSPVVVNISKPANQSRSLAPLVRQTVTWWESRPASQRDYTVDFVVRPNATSAGLTVRLVTEIGSCANETDEATVGCANRLGRTVLADSPTVLVEAGYTRNATLRILKHEFGHIYGRTHGEPPVKIMQPTALVRERPVKNATARELPWNKSVLSVYLNASQDVDAGSAWNDIEPALQYYERGAGGWLNRSVTFVRVDNQTQADIVINIVDDHVCGFKYGGICRIFQDGVNLDSDPAYERYTFSNMTVTTVPDEERAWFVGYGLGFALGAANQSDMPEPLQDITNADERWWVTD